MVKNLPANAGDVKDVGWIPGLERSPRGECGKPLQYACLENPMDRGAWQATVHGVAQSWAQLKHLSLDAWILKREGSVSQPEAYRPLEMTKGMRVC